MHDEKTLTHTWHPDDGHARRVIAFWDGGHVSRVLRDGEHVVIGRSLDCDLTVLHTSVSRRHVEVIGGAPPRVRDLGSANGTRVSGRRLAPNEETPLEPGDAIEIGSAMVMVRSATDTAPLRAPEPHAAMARVKKLVELVAASELSVLILGETGVGKEVTARTIHDRSARVAGPFVRVNCAALAESLLDSELFGHEKGAFTGATTTKSGLIEAANGGTLFLDEIGEAPLSVQAKLLRTLESREVRRVGGVESRQVDVRFVVATNRELPALVETNVFRRDLYYRLNGITIVVPPLRERRDEILGLARSFAGSARISPAAEGALLAHAFPGNVRELRNAIERAVVLSRGGEILPDHLLLETPAVSAPPAANANAPLAEQIDALEHQRILQALDEAGGNQTRAAEILGMPRRTLITKIERFGLPRPRKR
jgi:transcriptional regulator with GAF, ATPase, and Fis domain